VGRTLLGALVKSIKNDAPVPYVPRHHNYRMPLTPGATSGGFTAQMRALLDNGTLYAIVQRTIEAYAEVDWRLYRVPRDGRRRYDPGHTGAQDNRTEVTRHPALDLWRQPNPFHTGHAFRETTQQHAELTGEQYWVLQKHGNIPYEMWPVQPDRMFPVPHPTQFLAGYVYRSPSGEEIPLGVDDVIYTRTPNPLDIYRGLSPVHTIMTDLDATNQASEYTSAWFRNGATPGGVIQAEQNISDEDFYQFQARWRETHQGTSNTNRVAILEAGMTWQSVAVTHDDMQLVEIKESTRETIREAFGFPKAMMGATDDVNKANAYAGEVLFARWIIKPRLVRTREALNRFLLPMYGASAANLEFDFVNPVPEDDEIAGEVLRNKAEAAAFLAGTGLYDAESIKSVVGLPELEEIPESQRQALPDTALKPGQRHPNPAVPAAPAKESAPDEETDEPAPAAPKDWLNGRLFVNP
jgi:HK97 family phage portal protein